MVAEKSLRGLLGAFCDVNVCLNVMACYIDAFALSLMTFCAATDTSQARLIPRAAPDQGQVISDLLTRSITASQHPAWCWGSITARDGIGDRFSAPSRQPGPSHDPAPILELVRLFKAHEEGEKNALENVACAWDTEPSNSGSSRGR